MSLEKLFVTKIQDWSEVETGIACLIGPTFTQEFLDWLDSRGYHFPQDETEQYYVVLTQGFNAEFPVVVGVYTDTGPVWEYEMPLWDFATFIAQAC